HWLAWEEPLPFARLVGDFDARGRRQRIEITLVYANNDGSGGPRLRKEVRINGVTRRALDLVGQMPAVLFLPQDIELVAGSPGVRRRYLDIALCQMQGDYCRALSAYNRVLQQRNALLKALRERSGSRDQLAFWDSQLVDHGSLIVARRAGFIADLEFEANQRQQALTGGQERLHVRYVPSLDPEPVGANRETAASETGDEPELGWLEEPSPVYLSADPLAIGQAFHDELLRTREREIAAGMTLTGPHRDDVQFVTQGRDLRTYGSRGQQRTTALSVKLAEVALMQQALSAPPLLLLDDVMSELDSHRRSFLLRALEDVQQALVTTTDWEDFTQEFRGQARCLCVVNGRIERLAVA
ncbi:MAG: DNA replication/repair protein RecF, partial [Anaerolineae bacterium]